MSAAEEGAQWGTVNVATVPQRSPFRYPGGKTWLVPHVRAWLSSMQPVANLVEPFAGGAIVGLTAAFEGLAQHVTLVELDDDVSAVWEAIVNDGLGQALAEQILSFDISLGNVRTALAQRPRSELDRAFRTILRNRVQRGGILARGASLMNAGENGRGVKSRWYAETLSKRIMAIDAIKERITFVHGDGIAYLRSVAGQLSTAHFIDPPYTVAGRRLYTHSEIDHGELFQIASTLAGDFLMTYDRAEEIHSLAARHGFDTALVPMKSTHHERKMELLVGRDLRWVPHRAAPCQAMVRDFCQDRPVDAFDSPSGLARRRSWSAR